MFKSTRRPIVFPQSEHLESAGTLAFLWGSTQFEFPPLPRLSVIAGNALHDRAYGYLDNLPIGEIDDEQWVPLTRKGFFMPCADPIADVITRHHLLRLVTGRATPARHALAHEMRVALDEEMRQQARMPTFSRRSIARRTCATASLLISAAKSRPRGSLNWSPAMPLESKVLRYRLVGSNITLDPWPLQPEMYDSYLVAYQMEGYPEQLDALIAPYHLGPMPS